MNNFNMTAMLKHFQNILDQDKKFRGYLDGDGYSAYIRITQHFLRPIDTYESKVLTCFDIANIDINEEFRGQKVFTRLLDFLELKSKYPIYIECVNNPRLYDFLKRRGYIKVGLNAEDYNFVSIIPNKDY